MNFRKIFILVVGGIIMFSFLFGCAENKKLADDVTPPKAEKVKKELNLSHVYIILLTAKGQEVDRQKGLDMGADRYMTKPFDPDEMLSVAEEVLNV